ncbi:PREDICTED: CMRF35-like molecule 1 isoform X2 [Myotis brandtii]|uniref:CMRF35-like molecule 1 isoform X2 n=1 Tax=Myotis brandtii TaxID=109478 RepID=UPI0007045118|nr:PREDICTED: CMRF35-like molecule 1 isoform X2 [Myotis brandtii]
MYLLMVFPPFFLYPDSSYIISGPKEVRGGEWHSLSVQCHYDPGWETYRKWWCRGRDWISCEILVITNGSEMVKKNRVSIRDHPRSLMFTVIMKELRREDTDTYWCGIERTGSDYGVPVKVTIDPAATTVPTPTPTIASTANAFTDTPEDSSGFLNVTSLHPDGSGDSLKLCISLPLFIVLLLLVLAVVSLLVWRVVKRQKEAAGIPPEQVLQPPEDNVCYANLPWKQTGASLSSFSKRAPTQPSSSAQDDQGEVEYITMASFLGSDVFYEALSLDTLDQDSIYSNTQDLITPLPSRSQEQLIPFSAIRKP